MMALLLMTRGKFMQYIQQDLPRTGGPLVKPELGKRWTSGWVGFGEEEVFYFRLSDLRLLGERLILTMMALVLTTMGQVHAVYSTRPA